MTRFLASSFEYSLKDAPFKMRNLFELSAVPNRKADPRHGGQAFGFAYPMDKMLSAGPQTRSAQDDTS
jgi:hypothetical protein